MINQDDMLEIMVCCIICGKRSSKAHKYSVCELCVHCICGESTEGGKGYSNQVQCNLCCRKERINEMREIAQLRLTKPAENMIPLSHSKLSPVEIGSSFVVRVADVERGCISDRNVLTVLLNCIPMDYAHQVLKMEPWKDYMPEINIRQLIQIS